MNMQQYIKQCRKLVNASINFRSKFNKNIPLQNQILNFPQLLKSLPIKFPHDEFQLRIDKIGCQNIFAHPELRISVFHIPKGKLMNMHDHPQMHVITHILKGSMQATLLTKKHEKLYKKQKKVLKQEMTHFTEQQQNNYHQFLAKEQSCTFLDILLPDYNQTDRPCSYYKYFPSQLNSQLFEIQKLSDDFYVDMYEI